MNQSTEIALKSVKTEISTITAELVKLVEEAENEYKSIVPTADTPQDYDFCKKVRAEVLPLKTKAEKMRKALKDPLLDMGKQVDGEIKPLIERLEAVFKPFEKAYREKDNEAKLREEERQKSIQAGFDKLNRMIMDSMGKSAIALEAIIEELADFEPDPSVYQERTGEVLELHSKVMGDLSEMLLKQIAWEGREAELAKAEKEAQAAQPEPEKHQTQLATLGNGVVVTEQRVDVHITKNINYEPFEVWPSDQTRYSNEWISMLCDKLEEAESVIRHYQKGV